MTQSIWDALLGQARSDRIYLLPLRVFIGIGWLRAFVEKGLDPNWFDGQAIRQFFEQQLDGSTVAFPFYAQVIEHLWMPQGAMLGWLILVLEAVIGFCLLLGFRTSAALLVAMFLNVNFVLAGAPSPSAFYLVIQLTLLFTNAGKVIGFDMLTPKPKIKAAQQAAITKLLLAVACGLGALWCVPFIKDFSPKGSVEDPAAILAVLGGLSASWLVLAALRIMVTDQRKLES